MKILIRKGFTKSYSKLSHRDQRSVDEALVAFEQDPFQEELKNHALKGSMKG